MSVVPPVSSHSNRNSSSATGSDTTAVEAEIQSFEGSRPLMSVLAYSRDSTLQQVDSVDDIDEISPTRESDNEDAEVHDIDGNSESISPTLMIPINSQLMVRIF